VGEATGTYAVPPGYGVITAWSHSTGDTGGGLTFKVYRPTGSPSQFLVLAANAHTVSANTVHTFPVRIPVRPGDRIGISTTQVEVAYPTGDPADRDGFFPVTGDPPPGTTATLDGPPFEGYRADVAARVETDFDRDGLGDDTQDSDDDNDGVPDRGDACPTAPAATASGCADTTPPFALLRVRRTQKLRRSLTVSLGPVSEACRATVGGTVSFPGVARVYRLRGIKGRPLGTGSTSTFKLKLSRKALKAVKRALLRHKKVRARVKIVLTDRARNARTLKATVKLKR
jgi:hypothetical protein